MINQNQERLLYAFLVIAIFFGVVVRFWSLDSGLFWRDEPILFIAALKLNHHDPSIHDLDPRFWHAQYPPVGTYIMGLPTVFYDTDYTEIIKFEREWPLLYLPAEILKNTYYLMRLMSALMGLITVVFIFLITKTLWGTKPALWSTVVAALSVDYIGISRVSFLEVYMIAFFMGTLFFLIKYLQEKNSIKKFVYLSLIFIFTILTLGTRWGPPFLLYPILLLSVILNRKERANLKMILIFLLAIAATWPIFYYFINLPKTIPTLVEVAGAQSLFVNNVFYYLSSFAFKNSYLFLFGILFSIFWYYIALRKNFIERPKSFLLNPDERMVVLLFFLISTVFFSVTLFGANSRYFLVSFAPAMILMGKPLANLSQKKIIVGAIIILLLITIWSIFHFFPYYTSYGNFGSVDFEVLDFNSPYDLLPEQQEIFSFLKEQGNPTVFTNLPNLLVFYDGKAMPIPPYNTKFSLARLCDGNLKELMKNSYVIILGREWIFCEELASVEMDFIKEFGKGVGTEEKFAFGTISIFKVK